MLPVQCIVVVCFRSPCLTTSLGGMPKEPQQQIKHLSATLSGKKCAVALTCPSASHDAREGGRVEAGAKPLRRTLVWRMKLLPAVTGYKSSAIAAVTKKSNRRANLDWQNSGLCSGTWTNFSPGMCSGMYWNICSAIKEILAFKRAQNQALIWYILGVSLVIDVLHA